MNQATLKAPFPYFGGKRRAAEIVWPRLGDVANYIEPFAGSAAMLLCRPHSPRIETLNDLDCYVANFWRAIHRDPEAVAVHADWPVNEADLHARHRWLVLSEDAAAFRAQLRGDPEHFDARFAGWWCWGLCCWIGGGWCSEHGSKANGDRKETLPSPHGKGVTRGQLPDLSGDAGASGRGVHASAGPKRAAVLLGDANRPQLADAYARGRGVHGHDEAETCKDRREWLLGWFGRLADRLRTVRICCGGWKRVCDSPSVTTRLGLTGIFFDPPYSTEAGRSMDLYASDCGNVAHEVRAYCLERGPDPQMRIVLCGYEGEGHEELEAAGWEVVAWKAQGGYGNRSTKGKANADRERIWFSPHCLKPGRDYDGQMSMFTQEAK